MASLNYTEEQVFSKKRITHKLFQNVWTLEVFNCTDVLIHVMPGISLECPDFLGQRSGQGSGQREKPQRE